MGVGKLCRYDASSCCALVKPEKNHQGFRVLFRNGSSDVAEPNINELSHMCTDTQFLHSAKTWAVEGITCEVGGMGILVGCTCGLVGVWVGCKGGRRGILVYEDVGGLNRRCRWAVGGHPGGLYGHWDGGGGGLHGHCSDGRVAPLIFSNFAEPAAAGSASTVGPPYFGFGEGGIIFLFLNGMDALYQYDQVFSSLYCDALLSRRHCFLGDGR